MFRSGVRVFMPLSTLKYVSSFSVAAIKHRDQGSLQKEQFIGGLGFQRERSQWWGTQVVGLVTRTASWKLSSKLKVYPGDDGKL